MGVPGLRLNLGGAPETPHVVDGLPGLYWPTHPTPLDVIDGIDPARAQELHADPGVPLAFEEIADDATADAHRQKFRDELENARLAGGDAPRPAGGEVDVRMAQVQAIAPQPEPIPANTEPEAKAEGQTETE